MALRQRLTLFTKQSWQYNKTKVQKLCTKADSKHYSVSADLTFLIVSRLVVLCCDVGSAGRCLDGARRPTSFRRLMFQSAGRQSDREFLTDGGDLWRTDEQPLGDGAVQGLVGLRGPAAASQPGQAEAPGDQQR